MILRIDDTDVGRNTEASLDFHLRRPALARPRLGRTVPPVRAPGAASRRWPRRSSQKGLAYRDFTPAQTGESEKSGAQGTWLFNAGMRELSREESDRRAAAGEPFALRFRVPHDRDRPRRVHRRRLRRAGQGLRRYRRFRPAAQRRHADLSSGLLRRRRRPAHQPHHPRPGASLQHLQARADLRGRRRRRRPPSRTCRCWWRPTAPSSPSACTARWSASPPTATPAFCRRRSSTSSACWAGRRRTIARRCRARN